MYTRERKIQVVRFYHENNLYQISKKFSLNTKTIGCWDKDEKKIEKRKKKGFQESKLCQTYSGS